jgi:hypothetical protein
MVMAAAGLYGLSWLTPASSLNDTARFILLGLGLSPVMVGATDAIVGQSAT